MSITPERIRAARALLRLDQATIAQDAKISALTLRRLEEERSLSTVPPETVDQVRRVLEGAGAGSIDRRDGGRATKDTDIVAIKQDIDRIVARSVASTENAPPLTDDELFDENGL